MLQTLKNNKSKNVFYGINSGNYDFSFRSKQIFIKKNINKNLSKAKVINISPLEMKVVKNNKIKKKFSN